MQINLFCVSAPLSDNSLESVLEPLDGLVTLDLVGRSNMGLAAATLGNTLTRSGHAAEEVHSVNTDRRVVLDTEIDVLADTEGSDGVAGLAVDWGLTAQLLENLRGSGKSI